MTGLPSFFFEYTFRVVALGAAVLGLVSGVLGSFALLRRQSLLGDAMSHAALPGIVAAFILTRSREPLVLMLGALASGWLGSLLMARVVRSTRLKVDSAMGLVLAVFFGLGLVLLTAVQRLPDASQAGLNKYLFGQAAALLERDVISMAILGAVALLLTTIFWKEFKLLSFDPGFAASQGFPVRFLDVFLTSLLVVAIVTGLQAVGVVLMSAMIVAPAAAARQWTDRMGVMVVLSGFFGALSGVIGTAVSSTTRGLSTGPTIVITASLIVIVSLFLAPSRGLAWEFFRRQRNRRLLQVDAVLEDLYRLSLHHTREQAEHGHATAVLRAMRGASYGVEASLTALESRGLVKQIQSGQWALTQTGLSAAEQRLSNGASGPGETGITAGGAQ
jgi:manganese/zinc/iron transport system permease protein